LVKRAGKIGTLLVISAVIGIAGFALTNKEAFATKGSQLKTKLKLNKSVAPDPTKGEGQDIAIEPTEESTKVFGKSSMVPIPTAKRIVTKGLPQLPATTPRPRPNRNIERRDPSSRDKTKTLGQSVRKPAFLSKKEKSSSIATTRKFGLTSKQSTKVKVSGRTSSRRVTKTQLLQEQNKARKVFDSRKITNF